MLSNPAETEGNVERERENGIMFIVFSFYFIQGKREIFTFLIPLLVLCSAFINQMMFIHFQYALKTFSSETLLNYKKKFLKRKENYFTIK